jgi:predicted O-methyltransferase YrrM
MKSIFKPIVTSAYRYQAEFKLSQLRNIKKPAAEKVANALFDALKNSLDPEEKKWVDRIEEKRKMLNSSITEISITDFGAGKANLDRTEDEMYRGVVTETTVGEACRIASKPYFWSLFLFKLIREFKPLVCIELGTCLGISGAYQASAQKLNKNGRLITLEGSQSIASLAEENFQQLGLDNVQVVTGRFQDTLDRVLTENNPIDYAFIDGHHDEKATISYFKKVIPHLSKNSIIVFDDISWSDGMRRAWEHIEKNILIKISLNLGVIGVCVLDENIDEKFKFRIPML